MDLACPASSQGPAGGIERGPRGPGVIPKLKAGAFRDGPAWGEGIHHVHGALRFVLLGLGCAMGFYQGIFPNGEPPDRGKPSADPLALIVTALSAALGG